MLRVDQISISNYKNLVVRDLPINNFNLLVGPNNSGKSNFIQIISFLNHIINGSFDEIKNELKRANFPEFGSVIPTTVQSKKGNLSIELMFSDTSREFQYKYKLILGWKSKKRNDIPREEMFFKYEEFDYKNIHKTGPPVTIFKRDNGSINFGTGIKRFVSPGHIPENISAIGLLKVFSNEFIDKEIIKSLISLNSILKTETIYFSNIELSKPEKNRLTKFSGRTVSFDILDEIVNIWKEGKKFDYLKEVLGQILLIDDIEVFEFGVYDEDDTDKTNKEYFVLFYHLGTPKELWDLSDGSIMLIALVTKIIISNSSIFLIEEPENSLHPKALIDLLSFIRSYEEDKQFIIATHSIALINKVNAEDVIIAKCNENGTSELFRVKNSGDLRKKLKQGFIVFSDLIYFNPEEII